MIGSRVAWLIGAALASGLLQTSARAAAPPLTGYTDGSAPLFFREAWKHDYSEPGEAPFSQKKVASPNLEAKTYGDPPSTNPRGGIWENQTGPHDPPHTFTGSCRTPCALTLRDRSRYVDISGNAKFKWSTRISRLRYLHPIIKLADGSAYIGDYAESFRANNDYVETEMDFADINWLSFDLEHVRVSGDNNFVDKSKLDLTRVDEIGFTDLAPGTFDGKGAGARSNVAFIEVYGKAVPRASAISALGK